MEDCNKPVYEPKMKNVSKRTTKNELNVTESLPVEVIERVKICRAT